MTRAHEPHQPHQARSCRSVSARAGACSGVSNITAEICCSASDHGDIRNVDERSTGAAEWSAEKYPCHAQNAATKPALRQTVSFTKAFEIQRISAKCEQNNGKSGRHGELRHSLGYLRCSAL
jgi:hypothetical protein